ncbi:hypothetical protein Tco_0127732 [Tanacetum coccineum]
MSSITAQQTKLELELVPEEKRLEIGKCNRRINLGKKLREPTFQVLLDALALTSFYSAFLTTADVPEVYIHQFWDSIHKYENSYRFRMDKKKKFDLNLEIFRDIFQICPRVHGQKFDELPTNEDIMSFFKELGHTVEIKTITNIFVDQMHQPWRTFATIINRSLFGKTTSLDKLCLSRAQILLGMYYKKNVDMLNYFGKISLTRLTTETISKRNNIGMHTSRDDYLINTLRFVSAKEESQIYGAQLPKTMTSPKMRETKAYKTYLGYATGVTPPKKAWKFKKPASPKLSTVLVSPEEPTRKLKRAKRPAKKSTNAPTARVVIRDTPMKSLSKKKEKYVEVRNKSLRDFHKTHPSGSGTATKIAPSAAKIKPSVTNEGTSAKPGVPDVTKEESSESEAESWGRDEDDRNNNHELSNKGSDRESDNGDDNTQSNNEKGWNSKHETDKNETSSESDQEENEEENEDDGEEKDDELLKPRLSLLMMKMKPMMNQRLKTKLKITPNQVIEDAHVTLSTVIKKTEIPVTSSSHSSDLASKFLNFSDIPHTDAEIISPMDVHVHHEILPKEVSNFSPSEIKRIVTESLKHAVLANESSQPMSTYMAAASLTEFELKKILIDKMDESQSYLTTTEHRECYDGLIKSEDLDKSLFSTYDKVYSLKRSQKDKDKDKDPSAGSN